jgi:hypothetical protein
LCSPSSDVPRIEGTNESATTDSAARDITQKVLNQLFHRLDIFRVTSGARIESTSDVGRTLKVPLSTETAVKFLAGRISSLLSFCKCEVLCDRLFVLLLIW